MLCRLAFVMVVGLLIVCTSAFFRRYCSKTGVPYVKPKDVRGYGLIGQDICELGG